MKAVWPVLLAFVATTGFAQAAMAQTELVTVEQLLKSPPQELKHISVVGQVDNCSGFGCHLCPSGMTYDNIKWDQCLSLSFEGFSDKIFPASPGPNDHWVDVSGLMENAFRFATVVLDADYDPTCLTSKDIVCLDRAPVIVNARAVKVLSRKTARNGISSSDWGTLAEPDKAEKAAMNKAVIAGYPGEGTAKLFLVRDYPYLENNQIAIGLNCFCLKENCEKDWPSHYFLGFDSPANPFRCIRLEKHPDGWHVPIYD